MVVVVVVVVLVVVVVVVMIQTAIRVDMTRCTRPCFINTLNERSRRR